MHQPGEPSLHIIDVDTAEFAVQVIEKSSQVPVIVDFWAPWCEPCKTLGPIIEKVVNEAGGTVILAKVNIDDAQEIAAQMKIRSVPTVVAFIDGRPADAFTGVKTESEIRDFIKKIAPDIVPFEVDTMLEFANGALAEGNLEEAGEVFSQVLQLDTENEAGISGMILTLIKLGDLENARHVLSGAPNPESPAIEAAKAALETAFQIKDIGDIDTLRASVDKNDEDYQARFDLALALWAIEKRKEAADQLLYIITADKEWEDDGARKQLVKFFEEAGPMDPFTITARRKLSSLLFC